MFVGSWNFAGKDIQETQNLQDWLLPVKNTNTPDIYIIGFQEIVDLNAKNVKNKRLRDVQNARRFGIALDNAK